MNDDPRKNAEGYPDPTAYQGMKPIIRAEEAEQRRVNTLINVLKYIIDAAGFDLIERIAIRDRKTKRDYR